MFKKIYKLGEITLNSQSLDIIRDEHKLLDLFWETTLRCNANCKHCGSNAGNKQFDGELTTEEIKAAFKNVADSYDASKILINVTGGEPLVRKDLFEVMEYASNELGFHWGMTTNGILLTDENILNLKKANMETISISIDGLRDTHDSFRGVPGSYDKILSNIKKLKEAGFVKHIQVTTVFHKKNIDEMDELYNQMLDLQLDSWRMVSMDPIGRAKENEEYLLDGYELKRLLDFIKSHKKDEKLPITYGCQSYLGLDYEKEVRRSYFNCRTGISVASILYNGDLFVCPNVARRKELIQGNVKTDDFKDVWENKYKVFRDKERTNCDECKKCDAWDYCLGGSFHTFDFDSNTQTKCVYKMLKK